MTTIYMKLGDVNRFVRGLAATSFAALTQMPEDSQGGYDFFGHFARASDNDDPDFICDLDLDVHFFSEGPCNITGDDSFCSFDPEIPDARYPTGSVEIMRAKRVIECYLANGGRKYASSDEAIEG